MGEYSRGGTRPLSFTDNLTPLKLFVINFQSMLAKRAELIHEQQPDVIFGTETWLSPNINSTEFFPTGYSLFRKDQSDGYGGVLLAFKKDLTVIEYQIKLNSSYQLNSSLHSKIK